MAQGKNHFNVNLSLATARAFHASTKDSLAMLKGPADGPAPSFVDTIVTATNLTLAAEIYLKTALALQNTKPKASHNLHNLYGSLSSANQKVLRREFDQEIAKFPRISSTYSLIIGSSGGAGQSGSGVPPGLDLDRVLQDTGEAYKVWRYLFNEPLSNVDLAFHYVGLDALCSALDRLLVQFHGEPYVGPVRDAPPDAILP